MILLAQVVQVSVMFTPCRTCVVLLDLHLPPFLLRPVLPRLLPLLCPDGP